MNIKNNSLIFIFSLIISMQLTYCMQPEKQKTINPYEIATFVEKPHCALFLPHNNVLIAGNNGYAVVNITTKNIVVSKKIDNSHYDCVLSNDKKKYAISGNGKLKVYNAATHELEWGYTRPLSLYYSITFNSENNEEVISLSTEAEHVLLDSKDSYNNDPFGCDVRDKIDVPIPITCHPTQQKFECLNTNKQLQTCSIGKYTTGPFINMWVNDVFPYTIAGYQYNNNGFLHNTYDACLYEDWSNTINNTNEYANISIAIKFSGDKRKKRTMPQYTASQIHPNTLFAALLTAERNCIEYWSCEEESNKPVAITPLNDCDTAKQTLKEERRFSFSFDGRKLLVACTNKCFVLPVPFQVRHTPEAKTALFSIYSALKNQQVLPADAIQEIIDKLMILYEYPLYTAEQ